MTTLHSIPNSTNHRTGSCSKSKSNIQPLPPKQLKQCLLSWCWWWTKGVESALTATQSGTGIQLLIRGSANLFLGCEQASALAAAERAIDRRAEALAALTEVAGGVRRGSGITNRFSMLPGEKTASEVRAALNRTPLRCKGHTAMVLLNFRNAFAIYIPKRSHRTWDMCCALVESPFFVPQVRSGLYTLFFLPVLMHTRVRTALGRGARVRPSGRSWRRRRHTRRRWWRRRRRMWRVTPEAWTD